MKALRDLLARGVHVDASEQGNARLGRDICRFDLGIPLLSVVPRTTAEVVHIVSCARHFNVPIVPYGQRSAYWRPLQLEGAIALSTRALKTPLDASNPTPWVGAGTSVRELHEHFLLQGQCLPCHPDAFGDTSIGAMVATGFRSGVGMGSSSLTQMVSGLRLVLGTGEVLETGPEQTLGGVPFGRASMGDLTTAVFGSSGALGIVTEVALRPAVRVDRTRLSCRLPSGQNTARKLAGIARHLIEPGLYETFRCVDGVAPGEPEGFEVDVFVRAPEGVAQRERRVSEVKRAFKEGWGTLTFETQDEAASGPEVLPRWWGSADDHWAGAGRPHYSAVDVNAPYQEVDAALNVFFHARAEATKIGASSARFAMYAGPEFMNMGLHVMYPCAPDVRFSEVHPVAAEAMGKLAALDVQPYGQGRAWGPFIGAHPGGTGQSRVLKAEFDPMGLLHPGAYF